MTEQPNMGKLIEELKKDPGKTAKSIGKSLGMIEDTVRNRIKGLERSGEPEIKQLIAKRNAYIMGGTQAVRLMKRAPGLGYQKLVNELRSESEKDNVRARDLAEILNGLAAYCKEWKDAELRGILLEHKNRGGWMPGVAEDPTARYVEKTKEALKKDAGRPTRDMGKEMGISEDKMRAVLRKMQESKEPETIMLLSRRKAYADGGGALVGTLRESPGAKYPEIAKQIAERTGKRYDIAKSFRILAEHCKKHHDTEMMDLIIAHKKAGGWMP